MDGTTTQTDIITSAGVTGTSEDKIKAAELKGKSDALSDVNRTLAEAKKALGAATAAEKRVTQMLKDYEEDIRDDPDKLTTFRQRQVKQKADDDLATITLELTEAKERLKQVDAEKAEFTRTQIVSDVAARLGVDVGKLTNFAKLTDGSTEAIENIAKDLPKLNPSKFPSRLDSNRSSGGGQSEEQIREAYRNNPEDPRAKADYLAWRRAKGI